MILELKKDNDIMKQMYREFHWVGEVLRDLCDPNLGIRRPFNHRNDLHPLQAHMIAPSRGENVRVEEDFCHASTQTLHKRNPALLLDQLRHRPLPMLLILTLQHLVSSYGRICQIQHFFGVHRCNRPASGLADHFSQGAHNFIKERSTTRFD